MRDDDLLIMTCTCERTMPIDSKALEQSGCGRIADTATQLCRSDLPRFQSALEDGAPILVACTQERALFEEIAAETGFAAPLGFANIRETGGWSTEATSAGPKMAALIAAAAEEGPPLEVVTLESQGVALVLGSDDAALEAAAMLAESLDITVLLTPGADAVPMRATTFPILQGRARIARGVLGAFEVTVDDYAAFAPSSRQRFIAEAKSRNGAVSRCDIVIDLTGGTPLFPADELRPGYLKADSRNAIAVSRLVNKAAQLVGTFDKPRFVQFAPELCAHSRNTITGCTRCLDLCPTGAITSAGNTVAIDPAICAGCGQCAAACPTGAASYALPTVETATRRLRSLLRTYFAAGGDETPVILLHDQDHGNALIDASARFGAGLPAHVLPLLVNETTQVGPELIAAAYAYGAGGFAILGRARPRHDLTGLQETLAMTRDILSAMGRDPETLSLVETDDPEILEETLHSVRTVAAVERSSFLPPEDKRGLLTTAIIELNRTAPAPASLVRLEPGAPFGAVILDMAACTLCQSCSGACPTGALSDNPDVPMLRFTESACVQCGICEATCPEQAISLAAQVDFAAWDAPKRVLKQEEPFRCTECDKPFGIRSSIERVQEKLSGHWMFSGAEGDKRMRVLTMCEDCRVEAVVNEGFDPHEGLPTRTVRTAQNPAYKQ